VKLDWIKIIIAIFAVTALMAVETDSLRNFIGKYFPFQAALVENITSKSGEEAIFESEPEEEISEEKSAPADYEEESEGPEVNFPFIGVSLASTDSLTRIQNRIDEISEKIDTLKQEVTDLMGEQKIAQEKIKESEDEEEIDKEEPKIEEEEVGQEVGQVICERIIGAQPSKNKVIINEVAWMGGTVSANDEWIELKNISGTLVNLTSWQLVDKGKQIKIIFKQGLIPAGGFYLLERSNDESVPNILADLIYTGALSDSDEALYLFNESCQLEDEAEASLDWPAGDKLEKRSMERKADFSWQTSLNPGGTPKAENSSGYFVPPVGSGGTPMPEPTTYPKILISEVKIAEKIGDKNIFVELYNPNDFEVDLTDWYIFRNNSSFITKTLLEGEKIPPNDHFLITRKGSIWENQANVLFDDKTLNEDDKITLKNPKGEVVDEINWQDIPEDLSYGRIWDDSVNTYSDNFEAQDPTPKQKNKSPILPQDTTPPARTDGLPTGTLSAGTIETTISLTTDEIATCKYSINPDQDYDLITDTFSTTNEISHSALITGLTDDTSYNYYVRCVDTAGNKNTDDFIITFSITSSSPEEIPSLTVVINEIAWMGMLPREGETLRESANNEWIELYNNTNSEINLVGWSLKATDGTPEINLTKTILPQNFYLLERTDDNTLPEITADQTYTGALEDIGEMLTLYDLDNNPIDSVVCIQGNGGDCKEWPAGVKDTKQTMERKNPSLPGNNLESWATSNSPGGTPKSQNSQYAP
jgi:hypothetical protein